MSTLHGRDSHLFRLVVGGGVGIAICLLAACRAAPADDSVPPRREPRVVTFNADVAPILLDHCATCHRPVQSAAPAARPTNADDPVCIAGAPFSLLNYADAAAHATEIAQVTRTRAMPPWLPEPGHGDFLNTRRLSDGQVDLIQRWVGQGAPEGDAAQRPAPPAFPDGWQLGKPDLVLTADAYTLRPGRGDVFRNFVIPVPVSADRYVRAIEFRANNPRVIHHANVAVDPGRVSRLLDRADPGPGFAVMPEGEVQNVYGWSPGKVPIFEPEDTAWTLEEGSDLVVQLHMVPGAKAEIVRPSIGLFFSAKPPTRAPIVVKLESKSIDIPADESNYVVEDSYVLPADVSVVSVYPHAHYLAREMRGVATLPDGSDKDLIWIRQWDIRWQDQYRYRQPIELPKGTTLRMRYTYDNSPANPRSPRPARAVVWGQNSTDEMGALWVEVIPRRPEDVGVLTQDYFRRELAADVAGAELQARLRPTEATAHTYLATKYMQAGRREDARAELETSLRLSPGDAEAHSNLGTLLLQEGRVSEAIPHLAEAVRLEPDDDRVRFNLANGLAAAGRPDEALRELRLAVVLNPENADAHFNLAMLLGPRNELDAAVTHLRRVIEISPRNGEAHRNLSVAFGMQGRLDAAIREARTAIRLEPDSAAARDQLARLLAAGSRQ